MAYRSTGKKYRHDGRMSDARVAWANTYIASLEVRMFPEGAEESEEYGEQVGPNVLLGFARKDAARPITIALTSCTEDELKALRSIMNLAFDLAEPVARDRDKVAQRAKDQGDDSYSRIYRQLPVHVVRDGKISPYVEGLLDRPEDVPPGSGGVDGADRGGAGRPGDGLADEESPGAGSEDDSAAVDES